MRSKKVFFVIAAFVCSMAIFSQKVVKTIEDSNGNISKLLKYSDFESLHNQTPYNVIYKVDADSAGFIKLVGKKEILDLILIDFNENSIYFKNEIKSRISTSKTQKIDIYAYSSSISMLNVKGSGNIYVVNEIKNSNTELNIFGSGNIKAPYVVTENLRVLVKGSGHIDVCGSSDFCEYSILGSGNIRSAEMDVKEMKNVIKGSGDIRFEKMKCESLNCNISGSGNLILNGVANNAEFNLNGSGDIKALKFETQTINAQIKGSGSILCNVEKHLDVVIIGTGNINYIGDPNVKMKLLSSGKLKKIEL